MYSRLNIGVIQAPKYFVSVAGAGHNDLGARAVAAANYLLQKIDSRWWVKRTPAATFDAFSTGALRTGPSNQTFIAGSQIAPGAGWSSRSPNAREIRLLRLLRRASAIWQFQRSAPADSQIRSWSSVRIGVHLGGTKTEELRSMITTQLCSGDAYLRQRAIIGRPV